MPKSCSYSLGKITLNNKQITIFSVLSHYTGGGGGERAKKMLSVLIPIFYIYLGILRQEKNLFFSDLSSY